MRATDGEIGSRAKATTVESRRRVEATEMTALEAAEMAADAAAAKSATRVTPTETSTAKMAATAKPTSAVACPGWLANTKKSGDY